MNKLTEVQHQRLQLITQISSAMLDENLDEALGMAMRASLTQPLVEALLIAGRKPVAVDSYISNEFDFYAETVYFRLVVDTEADLRLASLIARVRRYECAVAGALLSVNRIPLWKVIWYRLSRRPLVTVMRSVTE